MLLLLCILNLSSFASANMFTHGRCIASLQTVLHPQQSSISSPLSSSSVLCKTSADIVLKVQGGSTAVRCKPQSVLDGDGTEEGDENQDYVPSSAATGTRTKLSTRPYRQDIESSFPLRLSTSQMGNNIVIDYVFQDDSLGRRKSRRNRWRQQKISPQNIRQHNGYKKYAKKLKVGYRSDDALLLQYIRFLHITILTCV
jgi:hypothetical protein